MGTRARVIVRDEKNIYALIFVAFDGHPQGLGVQIGKFMQRRAHRKHTFGDVGCLAAQLVSHLKGRRVGEVFLLPTTTDLEDYRDISYEYQIMVQGIDIGIQETWKSAELTPKQFILWCKLTRDPHD